MSRPDHPTLIRVRRAKAELDTTHDAIFDALDIVALQAVVESAAGELGKAYRALTAAKKAYDDAIAARDVVLKPRMAVLRPLREEFDAARDARRDFLAGRTASEC